MNDVLNRLPAEFRPLLNLEHLTGWTLDRQREHNADLSTYEGGRAVFQAVLRSQVVEGDRKWSARWRARKVEKQWNKLVKASRDAGNAAEALRTVYADHVREVAALPAQRARKAEVKAGRRGKVNAFAAKSMHKTAAAMTSRPDGGEEDGSETAGQSPDRPAADRTVRGVNDLFDRKGA
ncbi:hypothetical protein G6048_43450 [Streptomyces sp. YC419]|uniref:Transposase n=2 Tax=Streptomyces ureilyticus TaxID=1775131 RepID=A0ABX0E7E0_9ACTN|nr:hypothetical protein [Streptomyces ureilyticus]